MTETLETSVLIVGAGPVGLALAVELGWRGIDCVVIDQNDGKVLLPRASGISARTMEFCRRWGFADQVRAAGFPLDYRLDIVYCTSLAGHLLEREPYAPLQEQTPLPFSPENRHRSPQHMFDPVLEQVARAYPGVTLRRECRLEGFEETGDGVTAYVRRLQSARAYDFSAESFAVRAGKPLENAAAACGELFTVRARYMVACDGVDSGVRTALGIGLEGKPVLSYSVSALLRSPWLQRRHDKGEAERYIFVGTEGVWGNLTVVDGRQEWRLTIAGSEQKMDLKNLDMAAHIRRCFGRDDIPFEITAITPWRRRQIVAESFRRGRVFLAGDAVHAMSPTGGFGAGTGVGDSVDLGWKLEAVLRGWGGSELLDSYELERRPVGVRNTAAAADNFKPWLAKMDFSRILDADPDGAKARAGIGAALKKSFLQEWETWGTTMGYRYEGSPICVPDGTPEPPDDHMRYVQSARPGSRAPHAWLEDGRSTLDLFGRGFVLLRFGPTPPDAQPLAEAARRRGVPLSVVDIGQPEVAALYERGHALVRPDGHVAWRADALPADPLRLIDAVRGALVEAGVNRFVDAEGLRVQAGAR
jgi:2-polyprenyl-6-methoxyphenol hydroxylase-like FAD-dependent oxidoreductase